MLVDFYYSLRHFIQCMHARSVRRMAALTAPDHEVTQIKTLIIAPHQDDETLGCGGLIALKKKLGVEVSVVYLTDGSKGGDGGDVAAEKALVSRRRDEAKRAAIALGLEEGNLYFLDQPDGQLDQSEDSSAGLVVRLADLIERLDVGEIYVTHRNDGHPDHVAAYYLAVKSMRRTRKPARLWQYPIWMWWTSPFLIRLRPGDLRGGRKLDVGAELALKHAALGCFASQLTRLPDGFLRTMSTTVEFYFDAGFDPENLA